ncbi:hypothetical protein H4Q26_005617 [Puccinia striiformis f. sp. tritici PST-130]|nr:hypothetical protein Pst134EB_018613 [Puccinia striiformis f. sp. tritici]KAI9607103.1 hypothetical protein H4Q26_005617 [Puccinia striiformis f. sp. tritici PST-130]
MTHCQQISAFTGLIASYRPTKEIGGPGGCVVSYRPTKEIGGPGGCVNLSQLPFLHPHARSIHPATRPVTPRRLTRNGSISTLS